MYFILAFLLNNLNYDIKSDFLSMTTYRFGSSKKRKKSVEYSRHNSTTIAKTETRISEELLAMLHWGRWWPCCAVLHAAQMKTCHHAVQCCLNCTVLVHRSMWTLPEGYDQHWACHHTWWYWRFQWSTHAQYYWRSKPSLCTYRWFWQYN